MNFTNFRESNTSIDNSINYNLLYKQNKIPKQRYTSKNNNYQNKPYKKINGYKYYIPNLMNHQLNTQIGNRKFFTPSNNNYIKMNNIQSYGNINQRNSNDINVLKMKMGFDLLSKKINMIKERVKLINDDKEDSNGKINHNNNYEMENLYYRDKIRNNNIQKNKALNNNFIDRSKIMNHNNNLSSQSINYFYNYPPYVYNIRNYYNIQNLTNKQNKSNNYNDSIKVNKINKNNYNTNFNSLEEIQPKQKIEENNSLNVYKYNSFNNLKLLNIKDNINSINNLNTKYYKYSNSINNIRIPLPSNKQKKNKSKNNYNYFELIKKDNKESININNSKKNSKFANQRLNNFINKENNELQNKTNESFGIGKEYGSFDNYFLDNPLSIKGDLNELNIDIEKKIDIIYKNNNYNIYNTINKDKKIIDKNGYNISDNNKTKLQVENQKSVSYIGKNKNNLNNNNCEETDTLEEEDTKRNTFQQNQLKKCSESDLFLPKNNIINNDIIIFNNKDNKDIKDNKNNNSKDIINEKVNKKLNINKNVICKDDFYYDLYAEKIIDVGKNNYSADEDYKLFDVKERLKNKLEKKIFKENETNNKCINNCKKNKIKTKKVRFFEGENHFIHINQEEKVSKFTVYNYLGNKIYFKHCNLNDYLKKLKSKNYETKSILVNKIVENTDNSEWNILFDLINKIKNKNKSKNNSSNKIKKSEFKIKNIESFKKNGEKISPKNKIKEKDNCKKEKNIKKVEEIVTKTKVKIINENKILKNKEGNNKELYNSLYNTAKNKNIKKINNKKDINISKKNFIPKNNTKVKK